jgi:hypothetical protein
MCVIKLKLFTLKKHSTSVRTVQIRSCYVVQSVPLLPRPRVFCINPECDTLFGSGPVTVSCQPLKKSASPHPYLGQTASDWPLENKPLCFENQVWRLRKRRTAKQLLMWPRQLWLCVCFSLTTTHRYVQSVEWWRFQCGHGLIHCFRFFPERILHF